MKKSWLIDMSQLFCAFGVIYNETAAWIKKSDSRNCRIFGFV